MADKVPDLESAEEFRDPPVLSQSYSIEEYPSASYREHHMGDILPTSRPWSSNNTSVSSSEDNQLKEQYSLTVDQHLSELKRIRRDLEDASVHFKKAFRDKVDHMVKLVKQSFQSMHFERGKRIEAKCEEIGRVLGRVDKLVEGESRFSSCDREYLKEILKDKSGIEAQVEALINDLNRKRELDEQMLADFKEDIQQQVQQAIWSIERSLETQAEKRVVEVEKKLSDIRKALSNLQHLSKEFL